MWALVTIWRILTLYTHIFFILLPISIRLYLAARARIRHHQRICFIGIFLGARYEVNVKKNEKLKNSARSEITLASDLLCVRRPMAFVPVMHRRITKTIAIGSPLFSQQGKIRIPFSPFINLMHLDHIQRKTLDLQKREEN